MGKLSYNDFINCGECDWPAADGGVVRATRVNVGERRVQYQVYVGIDPEGAGVELDDAWNIASNGFQYPIPGLFYPYGDGHPHQSVRDCDLVCEPPAPPTPPPAPVPMPPISPKPTPGPLTPTPTPPAVMCS